MAYGEVVFDRHWAIYLYIHLSEMYHPNKQKKIRFCKISHLKCSVQLKK